MTVPIFKRRTGTACSGPNASPSPLHYITYAMPVVTMLWLHAPLVIVQGIYAKYYGLSLTTIAAVVLLGRIFDAVTDPLIGYYSDRYRKRTGTRKPFVLVGGLLMIVSGYFLYVPFNTSIVYFATWLFFFYFSYTLFDIPHNAWASEIAPSSEDKATIFSFRSVAVFLGLVLFYVIPLLPFFETRDITPQTLQVSVIAASILMVFMLVLCVKYTPNGNSSAALNHNEKLSPVTSLRAGSFRLIIQSIVRNKPLCLFFSGYLFFGLGYGMWHGVIFLYVDGYLGVGELFAQVFLVAYLAGIVATPVWWKLSIKLGKKTTMSMAIVLMIISLIYTSLLKPGESGLLELIVLKLMNATGGACILAMAPAMLSKIVDFSVWKFHNENTAVYFSLYAFLTKAGIAFGAALGLAIAGWYGFDATTTLQSAESATGLLIVMTFLPSAFLVIALVFTVLNPINAHRHGIIRRRLDQRRSRVDSITVVTEDQQSMSIHGKPGTCSVAGPT